MKTLIQNKKFVIPYFLNRADIHYNTITAHSYQLFIEPEVQ